MRYDYRNDYKNWTLENMKKHLPVLKEKLLRNIGICEESERNFSKRISYLNSRISKNK